jgi:D-alanyl-D-alanine dipeptidase
MDGPVKKEGDGKSPAGGFSIGVAYGYGAPLEGARLVYTRVDDTYHCVDDGASPQYNRIVSTRELVENWSSSEPMRRSDELYRWVIVIDHNPEAIAGAGSCIFFHVWRNAKDATVGCAAMERRHMEALLGWLDPSADPVVVLLPESAHQQLRGPWGLP